MRVLRVVFGQKEYCIAWPGSLELVRQVRLSPERPRVVALGMPDQEDTLLIEFVDSKYRLLDTGTRELRKLAQRPVDLANGSGVDVYPKAGIIFELWNKPSRFQLLNLDGSRKTRGFSARSPISPSGPRPSSAASIRRISSCRPKCWSP